MEKKQRKRVTLNLLLKNEIHYIKKLDRIDLE